MHRIPLDCKASRRRSCHEWLGAKPGIQYDSKVTVIHLAMDVLGLNFILTFATKGSTFSKLRKINLGANESYR